MVDRRAYPTWDALVWLFFSRLTVTALLMMAFSSSVDPSPVTAGSSTQIWWALAGYAVLVLSSGLALYAHWPAREPQVQLAIFADIVFFTIFMHLGGGVNSGLGVLLAISVAAGALLMDGRLSMVFASFAAVGVLGEQLHAQIALGAPLADFTRAGLLGATYYAVAILAHTLYRRIRAVERLAQQRKVDIEDLYKLNDFIIRKMETGVVVIDEAHRLRLMNAAAGRLLGRQGSGTGEPLQAICPPLADWVDRAVGRRPNHRTIHIRGREVQLTWEILGGDIAKGAAIFLQDTQELAQQAQQIKLAALGKLTGSIAHNIRNPLAAISHAGQLLGESTVLPAEDQHLVEIVTRNAKRIEETVQSILQLSRRKPSEAQNVELAAWLTDFCSDWSEDKGFPMEHLTLEISQAPLYVRADPRHLHQILGNLCDNAAKHARGDGPYANIQVCARRDQDSGRAICEVLDDGPGVRPDAAGEIFDPFYTTSSTGTGLGLYIARELAEANAIDLSYRARPSGASCFRLTFAA